MTSLKDIQPKTTTATELDWYKYIIDTVLSDDDEKPEMKFRKMFEHGPQSLASLHAAKTYAKVRASLFEENSRRIGQRVFELPERCGKMSNQDVAAYLVKETKVGLDYIFGEIIDSIESSNAWVNAAQIIEYMKKAEDARKAYTCLRKEHVQRIDSAGVQERVPQWLKHVSRKKDRSEKSDGVGQVQNKDVSG